MYRRAFIDELAKIAAASPFTGISGSQTSAQGSSGIPSSKGMSSSKPTNYSIINSNPPPANFGGTAAQSKALPPPPVRT